MILTYSATRIFSVLIDTWWNVNSTLVFSEKVVAMVLIDTWWNVNQSNQNGKTHGNRF